MIESSQEFKSLDLFPLAMTLFPDGIIALNIFEPRYLSMVKRNHQRGEPFGVVTLLQGFEVKLPGDEIMPAQVGTLAKILEFEELQPALFRIKCVGWRRFEIIKRLAPEAGVERADVVLLSDDPPIKVDPQLQGVADTLGKFIAENQARGVKLKEFPFSQPFCLDECGWVANRWAELLNLERMVKVSLLGELDPLNRLRRIQELMHSQDNQ